MGSMTQILLFFMSALSTPLPDFPPNTTEISLAYQGYRGTIPDSWASLTALTSVNIQGNQLAGNVRNLAKITTLEFLDVTHNDFSGIVDSISALRQLTSLNMGSNHFTGSVRALASMRALKYIEMQDNSFSGPINITLLKNLTYLNMYHNELSGSLDGLGHCTKLSSIYLNSNYFSGSLPSLKALWTLKDLYVHNNQLTGFHGFPRNLRHIYMNDNQFNVHLGYFWQNLTMLTSLYLSNNSWICPLPSQDSFPLNNDYPAIECFTEAPSTTPSSFPSVQPTVLPSRSPSTQPSTMPSPHPSVSFPSHAPTAIPTDRPSTKPSLWPSTQLPTLHPLSRPPSVQPTRAPTFLQFQEVGSGDCSKQGSPFQGYSGCMSLYFCDEWCYSPPNLFDEPINCFGYSVNLNSTCADNFVRCTVHVISPSRDRVPVGFDDFQEGAHFSLPIGWNGVLGRTCYSDLQRAQAFWKDPGGEGRQREFLVLCCAVAVCLATYYSLMKCVHCCCTVKQEPHVNYSSIALKDGVLGGLYGDCSLNILLPDFSYTLPRFKTKAYLMYSYIKNMGVVQRIKLATDLTDLVLDVLLWEEIRSDFHYVAMLSMVSWLLAFLTLLIKYFIDISSYKNGLDSFSRKILQFRWSIFVVVPIEDIIQLNIACYILSVTDFSWVTFFCIITSCLNVFFQFFSICLLVNKIDISTTPDASDDGLELGQLGTPGRHRQNTAPDIDGIFPRDMAREDKLAHLRTSIFIFSSLMRELVARKRCPEDNAWVDEQDLHETEPLALPAGADTFRLEEEDARMDFLAVEELEQGMGRLRTYSAQSASLDGLWAPGEPGERDAETYRGSRYMKNTPQVAETHAKRTPYSRRPSRL